MYDVQDVIAQYGEQLFNEQLEKEAKYKALGGLALQTAYDKAKAESTSAQTKLGQKMMTFRPDKASYSVFENAVTGMEFFVKFILRPHKGCKQTFAHILQALYEVYDDEEDGLETMYQMLTFSTFSNMLSAVINSPFAILNNVTQKIAEEIQDEYNMQSYMKMLEEQRGKKDAKKRQASIEAGINKRVQANYKRVYARNMMKHDGYTAYKFDKTDLQTLCVQLVHVVMDETGYFVMGNNAPKGMSTIEATDELLEAWQKNEANVVGNAYKVCPCVIPPRPWTSFSEGGYYGDLQTVSTLLRIHDMKNFYGKKYIEKLNQTDISQVLKAVNAIQATPWKINKDVLAVALELVNRGGDRAKLPNIYKAKPPVVFKVENEPTPEELAEYKAKMPDYYKAEARRSGIVLRMNSTLRVAQDFADYEKIYFPCNMDFRGRVYPIPSFSFQGDDLNKALIEFADVPPMASEEDEKWLAIHTANVAGQDKISFDDRIKWTYANMGNILEAAADPNMSFEQRFWFNYEKGKGGIGFSLMKDYATMKEYNRVLESDDEVSDKLQEKADAACARMNMYWEQAYGGAYKGNKEDTNGGSFTDEKEDSYDVPNNTPSPKQVKANIEEVKKWIASEPQDKEGNPLTREQIENRLFRIAPIYGMDGNTLIQEVFSTQDMD